jgi:hypothetical protein
LQYSLRDEEYGLQVNSQYFIPVLLRNLGQGLRPTDARVVYQNGNAPQLVFYGVHKPRDFTGLCNIRLDGQSATANSFDL